VSAILVQLFAASWFSFTRFIPGFFQGVISYSTPSELGSSLLYLDTDVKPAFQVAASCKGSDIRILNEPLEGSALFLVETGEG